MSTPSTTLHVAGRWAARLLVLALGIVVVPLALICQPVTELMAYLCPEYVTVTSSQFSLEPLAFQAQMSKAFQLREMRESRTNPHWRTYTDERLLNVMKGILAPAGWHLHVKGDDIFVTVLGAKHNEGATTDATEPNQPRMVPCLAFPGPFDIDE